MLYQVTYARVGRHGSDRPDSPPAPPVLTVRAVDADELALEILQDVRRYLGSRFVNVLVNLEDLCGRIMAGPRDAGSFTIAPVFEPASPLEQVEDEMRAELEPVLPRVSKAAFGYLQRFAEQVVHVYRSSDRPGNGVSRPSLDRLLGAGLVVLGDHEALKGRPVLVTDVGRAVLAQQEG